MGFRVSDPNICSRDRTRPITFFSLAANPDGISKEEHNLNRRAGYAALVVAAVDEERQLPR